MFGQARNIDHLNFNGLYSCGEMGMDLRCIWNLNQQWFIDGLDVENE